MDPRPPKNVPPYMLTRPRAPELIRAWEDFWTRYVLELAEAENLNMVSVVELRRREPFNQMDEESFGELLKVLLRRGLARWEDTNRRLLRIYWCGPDYWIGRIIEALSSKSLTGLIEGPDGLIELVPELASLPVRELEGLLELMVEKGLAVWLDKRKKLLRVRRGLTAP